MESSEAEADQDADSVALTLVFHPPTGAGATSDDTFSTQIRVKRERVNEVRSHLEARPEILCEPDRDEPGSYRIEPGSYRIEPPR